MKEKKTIINLLILAEAIILAIVLVLSVYARVTGKEDPSSSAETTESASEESETESEEEDTPLDDTTAEEENSIRQVADTWEEVRITFSDEVEELLSGFTTEELVAQLFVTTPEELTGVSQVTLAGDGTKSAFEDYPVSGLVYSSINFAEATQTKELIEGTEAYSEDATGLSLFLIVEELGGDGASPVASANGYEIQDSPAVLGESGSTSKITASAEARTEYLLEEGFNTIFGPIADTADDWYDADSAYNSLCFGTSALNIADYVSADIRAVQSAGMVSIARSFPGTNAAEEDYSAYQAAIDAGVTILQVSNTTSLDVTGDGSTPCTLSAGSTQMLREDMGFTGILMTADLSDEAITEDWEIGDAAVKAIQSGMNLIYVSEGFEEAYEAVLEAVESGEITEEMLCNAAGRILTEKLEL